MVTDEFIEDDFDDMFEDTTNQTNNIKSNDSSDVVSEAIEVKHNDEFNPLDGLSQVQDITETVNIYADLDAEENKLKSFNITPENLIDPKYMDVYKQIMLIARKRRNRMFESEFEKFIPLFKQDNCGLSRPSIDALYKKWTDRVSLYDPVEVYDNHGTCIRVIPASFARTSLLSNNVGPQIAANTVEGMNFAHSQPDDIHNKQGYWGNQMARAFRLAQDSKAKAEQVKIAEAQANALLNAGRTIENHTNHQIQNNKEQPSNASKTSEVIIDGDIEEYL